MVNSMGTPEPSHSMRHAVIPIIEELLPDKACKPVAPMGHWQRP
ncbi:hypothetical protein CFter6_4086 [Collimonas fungivorans]|uniref:Uncharacterized protein n=1 Tax=Collimonas fungivorans TaxID=158899 RepID=A0A127PG47_9BURK|nr:hypothetical protein CFter6_4086 [Collimonas fungivorans]